MFNRIIPFWMYPGSWGLKGKTYDRAEAEYNLKGVDLERRIIEIDIDNEIEKNLALLTVDRKYNLISKEAYDYKYAELKFKGTDELPFVKLELDKKYNKISDFEYKKQIANLNNEPWIGVLNSEYNPGMVADGFTFELDWNDQFIEMLKIEGYNGTTDEHIVEQWFEDKATEEYMSFLKEEAENIPETDDWSVPATHIAKEKTADGKIKHS